MREIENLKAHILKEYPRLSEDSSFTFSCHRGVPCFNECCGDVNIFLTPYDIIRLKTNLGISSTEFLKQYTLSPFDENLKYPVILLQMNDDEKKTCPFVTPDGCRVYPDRPWACRMYPLGLASPGEESGQLDQEFYFLLEEGICQGFKEKHKWTVSSWLQDQGITEFNRMGEHFKELTTHRFFVEGGKLPPEKIEMFFVACYDIDRFRKMIFNSSFLDKFDIDDATVEKLRSDDIELLRFGCQWLRFALFNEPTMKIKSPVMEQKKRELIKKGKLAESTAGKVK